MFCGKSLKNLYGDQLHFPTLIIFNLNRLKLFIDFLSSRIRDYGKVIEDFSNPVDTGRKLKVHKTFRKRPGRPLNVLCTFNLRPVSTEKLFLSCGAELLNNFLGGLYFFSMKLKSEPKEKLKRIYYPLYALLLLSLLFSRQFL